MSDDNQFAETQHADQKYLLPNGMSVFQLNTNETKFTYKEIFGDEIYSKHGIKIKEDACIFDVGANIGLFVMFAKQICSDAKIIAFEPAPDICRLLRLNTDKYGSSVQVFQCGISDEEKETRFTYYPNYSIMSGFCADFEEDKQTLSAGIRNQAQKYNPKNSEKANKLYDLLVEEKLKGAKQLTCRLRTVSSVLRELGIDRISLLKIDAEKSELQVLRGVDECDWPHIDQVVMEVHSQHQSESAVSLLRAKGFEVNTEQEDQFIRSGITNIFAKKR